MTLAGKSAVITGGGSGIGLGIAQAFAQAGCQVVIAGRDQDKLEQAVASCDVDAPMLAHAVDVTDRESVARLVEFATEKLGKIDILVNSAGTNIKTRTMATMTPDQWDFVMSVNVTGAYNCMQQVLPQMRSRKDGLILNVSSVAGKRAIALGGIAYCASKFAMTALGTAAGNEEAENGIRITNIYPGEVNTPILENRPEPVSDERKAAMVQPEDIGALAVTIACLPQRAHVSEILIKPLVQQWV